jgi:hypothetical protein
MVRTNNRSFAEYAMRVPSGEIAMASRGRLSCCPCGSVKLNRVMGGGADAGRHARTPATAPAPMTAPVARSAAHFQTGCRDSRVSLVAGDGVSG